MKISFLQPKQMKEIKSHYEKIIKQFQAKVTELEVSNSKLTDNLNDLHQGRYSVESEQYNRKENIRIFRLKQEDSKNVVSW